MIENTSVQDLLSDVQDMKASGYRLIQICGTPVGELIEVLYAFEKDDDVKCLKFTIDAVEPELHSVTAIYSYAFVYENEIHDLFGITFKNISLDFGGNFYKLSKKTPWNPVTGKGGAN